MQPNDPLILVINCGSSSLKFAVFRHSASAPVLSGLAESLGKAEARITFKEGEDIGKGKDGYSVLDFKDHATKVTQSLDGGSHSEALDVLLKNLELRGWLRQIIAIGHRVVHGGERFKESIKIDESVLADVDACSHLAPLHNPANVLGVRTAMAKLPAVPNVAVFDTAFHQSIPPAAYTYALPQRLYREHGVRRYGFHGTSHRYVAEEAVRLLKLDPADHGIVIAHLGNGASATAVLNGKSVDTSMGLTPLEGLVMGTRSGDVDPGIVGYLADTLHLGVDGIMGILNNESGLLGISELSNDCRTLELAARDGHPGAKLALDVFAHRLARYIGALSMSLKRLDAVVFTGGIGENSATVRRMTIERLGALGLRLDEHANTNTIVGKAGRITTSTKPMAAVIPTNEEWMIARDAANVVMVKQGGAV